MPRPSPATWVFLALGAALYLISRTSGAGWILVILSALVALVVVNAIWAWVVVRSLSVSARVPRDAAVGQSVDVEVTVLGIRSLIRFAADDWNVVESGLDTPGTTTIVATPAARGVFEGLDVTVMCDAPFGLARVERRCRADFEHPAEVAPRPLPHPLPQSLPASHDGDGVPQHRVGDGDVVRSLREYSVGDAPRLIHWAASARAGDLRVKELEPPDHPHLEVSVDVSLPTGELAAARAAGLVRSGLNAGLPVVLHTHDIHGPLSGPVGSALEAGRRLARAVPGVPPTPVSEHAVRLS